MSTVADRSPEESPEESLPAADETEEGGLVELGAVSQTQGGILGTFSDVGDGWQYLY